MCSQGSPLFWLVVSVVHCSAAVQPPDVIQSIHPPTTRLASTLAGHHVLDEAERSLHDALCVLSQTVLDSRVIYGGGWAEMQVRGHCPRGGGGGTGGAGLGTCAPHCPRLLRPADSKLLSSLAPPPLRCSLFFPPSPPLAVPSAALSRAPSLPLNPSLLPCCSQMARVVDDLAARTPGKKSLAMAAFGRALRQMPTIICDNAGAAGGRSAAGRLSLALQLASPGAAPLPAASVPPLAFALAGRAATAPVTVAAAAAACDAGLDAAEIVSQMRAAHAADPDTTAAGVDVVTGSVGDMQQVRLEGRPVGGAQPGGAPRCACIPAQAPIPSLLCAPPCRWASSRLSR
jgi:hypothetical protein